MPLTSTVSPVLFLFVPVTRASTIMCSATLDQSVTVWAEPSRVRTSRPLAAS